MTTRTLGPRTRVETVIDQELKQVTAIEVKNVRELRNHMQLSDVSMTEFRSALSRTIRAGRVVRSRIMPEHAHAESPIIFWSKDRGTPKKVLQARHTSG